MKKTFLSFLLIGNIICAQNYFQQQTDYKIDVVLDDKKNLISGKEIIEYTNNSSKDLSEIYLHLYWNAFQLNSHAHSFALNHADKDAKKELDKLGKKDEGYCKISSIKVNGINYTPKVKETIAQIKLSNAIKANSKATIEIEFESMVPSCINRSGKNNTAGTDYSMSQWYPKMCRYDMQGWATDPYIGREFAGTFGKFDVSIVCDDDYVLAGTGVLLNKTYNNKGWENKGSYFASNLPKGKTKWMFVAENVHDFAWAADKDFIHELKTIKGIDFHFFYHDTKEEYTKSWTELISKWYKAYEYAEENFGRYPYEQFSFIQAGEGYMEYPMCTFLEAHREDFMSTACHEFMHNYFYGIYGTNENLYHWMDEGMTSYADVRLEYAITGNEDNPSLDAINNYLWIRKIIKQEEPVSTSANYFAEDYAYYTAAYYRGQLFAELIRYMIGENKMKQGFKLYYERWKFKHPEPNDFVNVFEEVSGMELTWFQNYWLNTVKQVDYKIVEVKSKGKDLEITIENKNNGVPLPIEMAFITSEGKIEHYYIPLDMTNNPKTDFNHEVITLPYMSFADKTYTFTIENKKPSNYQKIFIDGQGYLPDLYFDDNIWEYKTK